MFDKGKLRKYKEFAEPAWKQKKTNIKDLEMCSGTSWLDY
jgi:hypothetical protein